MSDAAPKSSLKGVLAFLLLAFGIAWGSWELLLPKTTTSLTLFELAAFPGAVAPALATFIVRKCVTREGFGDAGLSLHLRKWRYYLIAWFLPFGVVAFIVATAMATGIAQPDFTPAQALAHLPPQISKADVKFILPLSALLTAFVTTPLLFGEEFGWRGYLQLRLFPGRPISAAIITGLIWGIWHWPLLARGFDSAGDPLTSQLLLCVCAVFLSIIFGWLREKSGSVWVTSLAHAATNGIGGSLTTLWFPDHSKTFLVGYFGLLSFIPLGLFSLWIAVRSKRASP
jgi:membrane protease YdiL (CAAX protease family)